MSSVGFFVEKKISVKKVGSQLSIDFKIINKINFILKMLKCQAYSIIIYALWLSEGFKGEEKYR